MALIKTLVLATIVIVVSILAIRTLLVPRPHRATECRRSSHWINATETVLGHFTDALRLATVSREQGDISTDNLKLMLKHIVKSYPILHSSPLVKREVVGNFSLLYTIQGTDKSLKPYMLAAHLDVVPVNEQNWEVPPFAGRIHQGYIYGRGAMDDKHAVMGILEAIEAHLKSSFVPKRTIYLAFGHDEEIQGFNGAKEISKLLQSRNVKLQFLLDEGMFILKDVIKMVDSPVANIAVAEKGFLTLKLTVTAAPGHSSVPPRNTAIGIMAKAISRLEDNPQRNLFGKGVETAMFEQMAPYTKLPLTAIFANLWAFNPILVWYMSRDPILDPLVRTTTAVTIIEGGTKANVLPDKVTAHVNHRIHPAQTVAEVIAHDMSVINDDRVTYTVEDAMEPSPISPYTEAYGFEVIKASVREIFPDVAIVPSILMAATDCKWYLNLTEQIYRFTPTVLEPADIARYHGDNERISVENYEQVINFYHHVIVNAEKETLDQLRPLPKVEL